MAPCPTPPLPLWFVRPLPQPDPGVPVLTSAAAYRTSQLVGYHVSRTGDAVTAELATGEVVATVASDSLRVGEVSYVSARFVGGAPPRPPGCSGPAAGSVVA